ncbi:hypothetical protein [Shewanella mangrovi]|uniref:hypothetical protein n=1 Tax=Shewanella mangrovi TaxID=1515746 RepID=UPI00068F2A34|nr:hypothetical protein [Shewanella mangrovi]
MNEKSLNKLASDIADYCLLQSESGANTEDLIWLLSRWDGINHKNRVLTEEDIKQARKLFANLPTGKHRHYQLALKNILQYLEEQCSWTLPEATTTQLIDASQQWFKKVAPEANNASAIKIAFEKDKVAFFDAPNAVSTTFMALCLALEVAPLPLCHIAQILSNSTCMDVSQARPRLRIFHLVKHDDEPTFTHYALTPFSYRLLSDYYTNAAISITEEQLVNQLNQWAEVRNLAQGKVFTWHYRFQIWWFVHFNLPPQLIKDLSFPERHFAVQMQDELPKIDNVFEIGVQAEVDVEVPPAKKVSRAWPHNALFKRSRETIVVERITQWRSDNILPQMVSLYAQHLLVYGGPIKQILALATIKSYTGFTKWLEPFSLSYADATNEEALQQWALALYDSVDGESCQKDIYKFLKFMSVQELTEGLDIANFTAPSSPISVNAFRLDLAEFDRIINLLIETSNHNPIRTLFSVAASLLGMFSMLRRGEVLRLRKRDIKFDEETGALSLFITHTEEGRTKNGKSRDVHTLIPKCYRPFFAEIFAMKHNVSAEQPFIGFEGESISSREHYYLLPVSRALKTTLGSKVTFHHLRHSGTHLLVIQAFRAVSEVPEGYHVSPHPLAQEMLATKAINARFNYWLEERPFRHVNHGILLDEICRELAHQFYGTTRRSYLHDIDWMLEILSPEFREDIERTYSHQTLRYLFGLSPTSTALSKKSQKISPEYSEKSPEEKRLQPIKLTIDDLWSVIFPSREQTPLPFSADHFLRWRQSSRNSNNTLPGYLFLEMLKGETKAKNVDFSALSQLWRDGAGHFVAPLPKSIVTALKSLPPIELDTDQLGFVLRLACNTKNAQAFTKAFRHKELRWLNFSFELAINRKLRSDRQETILKTQFALKKEASKVIKHPSGQTQLTIYMRPTSQLSKQVINAAHHFLIQTQQHEEVL